MNLSKNLVFSVVLSSLFTTSCKKFIDCVDSQPTAADCKIVSTTETVNFIYANNSREVFLPVIRRFYYNANGNPDSIVWNPYGKDTTPDNSQAGGAVYIRNFYFKYDAMNRVSASAVKSSYNTAPPNSLTWDKYTYPNTHTIIVNGSQTITLDDSKRVVSDGRRTYEYDTNGNLILDAWNEMQYSNAELFQMYGSNTWLTYTLDKKSPRQLSWVFMFIDRDFSKNASQIFSQFNVNGYPQHEGGPPNSAYNFTIRGYQDIFFGDYAYNTFQGSDLGGERSIQYACTETPPSKK